MVSEVFREAQLESVVWAPNGLPGDPAEINGQPLADLVVPSDLFLQLTSAQGKICGVAAINLDTQIEFLRELMGEGRATREDRAARLDPDSPGKGVAGERGTAVYTQRVLGRQGFLQNTVQVLVDEP